MKSLRKVKFQNIFWPIMALPILSIIFGMLVAGCDTSSQKNTISSLKQTKEVIKPLSDSDKIELLRRMAISKNVHWEIFCVPKSDGTIDDYQADAFLNGTKDYGRHIYIEEGVRDWWSTHADSPADAAYSLYLKIQGPPNQIVDHRPTEVARKRSGCDYNTVLSSKTIKPTPCEEVSK